MAFAGTIVGWGYDGYNQVSDVPTGDDFVTVAAGAYHGYAIKADGSLVAWGKNLWAVSKIFFDFIAKGAIFKRSYIFYRNKFFFKKKIILRLNRIQ